MRNGLCLFGVVSQQRAQQPHKKYSRVLDRVRQRDMLLAFQPELEPDAPVEGIWYVFLQHVRSLHKGGRTVLSHTEEHGPSTILDIICVVGHKEGDLPHSCLVKVSGREKREGGKRERAHRAI